MNKIYILFYITFFCLPPEQLNMNVGQRAIAGTFENHADLPSHPQQPETM